MPGGTRNAESPDERLAPVRLAAATHNGVPGMMSPILEPGGRRNHAGKRKEHRAGAHGSATSVKEMRISKELRDKCARAALGCVEAEVEAVATRAELDQALRACEERIVKLGDPRAILEAPAILATRSGYKALGKDPARYRGSAEALLRRVIAGKGLPRINSVVDVINLVSVESRLPIGLYDLDRVEGAVEFRPGRPGETYKGIGKYDLNLEGLPLFADARGAHGSATSDSERTMVSETTRRVLAVIVSFAGASGLEQWNQRLSELLTVHAAGKSIETRLVS